MAQVVDQQALAPLGSVLKLSLDNYEWVKTAVSNNKTLGPRCAPLFDFGENTTKKVLDVSPIKLESVIDAVDTRVDAAVNYGSETVQAVRAAPGKIKDKSLTVVHTRLNGLKVDEDEEPAELGFGTVAEDVKVITSERLNMLLDASEGYLAQYLPISDEDKEEIKVEVNKGELKPLALRAGKQSKVAAKKFQEQVVAKWTGIKTRTTEVVHVDLVKYSEYLDSKKNAVTSTIYIALEKVDEKAVQPVKAVAEKGLNAVNTRVITPTRERIVSVRLPFQDRFVRIWTVVGEEYESKVVKPRAQIVQMFREELALQQELAREKSGSGEDLTITAGIKAVVAAARARVAKEMDGRVYPTINKVLGRNNEEEKFEDEEDSE